MKIALAQIDTTVGDIPANLSLALDAHRWAEAKGADLLVLPELTLTGYPPEDLLLDPGFTAHQRDALDAFVAASVGNPCAAIIGFADTVEPYRGLDASTRTLANAAAVIEDGRILGIRHKVLLPNYSVFDEARYFAPGRQPAQVFSVHGTRVAVVVCEDLWRPEIAASLVSLGADLLVVPNASPYQRGKPAARLELARRRAKELGVSVAYLNLVGGQDELVFDGGSMVVGEDGRVRAQLEQFTAERMVVDLGQPKDNQVAPALEPLAETYQALACGLRAYTSKNGFSSVVLGLSGGVDSALVATLAVDALGAPNVHALAMPGPYSSGGSVTDAAALAQALGIEMDTLPITGGYDQALSVLRGNSAAPGPLQGTSFGVAEENLQARLRMVFLMAVSNKTGALLLTTGNKSETSVGFCTLYGDTAGGFAPIKDVYKTLVYDLCDWRQQVDPETLGLAGPRAPLPISTLTKAPSAELAPNQSDEQSLPPYVVLDAILSAYIEERASARELVERGFDASTVSRVVRLVEASEYKRRQAPPGVRVTSLGFGRDRRLPLTNRWRAGG